MINQGNLIPRRAFFLLSFCAFSTFFTHTTVHLNAMLEYDGAKPAIQSVLSINEQTTIAHPSGVSVVFTLIEENETGGHMRCAIHKNDELIGEHVQEFSWNTPYTLSCPHEGIEASVVLMVRRYSALPSR